MRPDVSTAQRPLTLIRACITLSQHWPDFSSFLLFRWSNCKHAWSRFLSGTALMQQSELFTKCAATCLPFARLPISPYFPPPRGYWWFERSSAETMKGKGKYVTHPHTSITGTAARCFWKAWHINTMHSKRTVMDNILTFGGISTWNNESLCREIFRHWHYGEPWEKRRTMWTNSDKNTPWNPPKLLANT